MKKNVHEMEIKLDKEWTEALDKAFKKKNKEVKLDGFRKGAAPKEVYIKKFGIESLYMDAVDIAIQDAYRKALDESKLVPAIEPKVDVTGISDTNVIFKFTIITRPEITLGEYKNLGIKMDKPKVTEKDIDAEIKTMQDNMADLVVKENGTIVEGNTAIIDFNGFVDGKELDGGKGENYSLEIGSHSFIPGFEDGLVGHKAGENVTLNLKFPDDYVEELKGKEVRFEVKINEVKERIVPEINEEFFKDLGYDDVKTKEDLKKKVKAYLEDKKTHELEEEFTEKLIAKASENLKVDINEEIIDDEVHQMIHQYEEQLRMQGLSLEQMFSITGKNEKDLHEKFEPEAEKRVKYRYLIEEVAKAEKIEFTEKEVKAEAKKMAENYGITVDELIKAYGTLDIVKYDMTMHKAIDIIKEANK